MGDKSSIEWTDATWNPVVGCSHVSDGCRNCYAEELHRTRLDGAGVYPPFRPWTYGNAAHNVVLVPERLDQPVRWQKPRMVFVNSMSDLFHELVPDDYVQQVFDVMAAAPQHIFQVLTKRPERMREFRAAWHAAHPECGPLPNVWLGTSIESARHVDRADRLRDTPAAVRFISAEPLLGPLAERITHGRHCFCSACAAQDWSEPQLAPCGMHGPACPPRYAPYRPLDLTDIDWLIAGGESGPEHRPMEADWVRQLRDAASVAGTAFFFKQWGGRTPKAGGRELDGRTWDELPAQHAAAMA